MRVRRVNNPLGVLLAVALSSFAITSEARELRNPVVIGSAEVRLFGFKLYDASLLTPNGARFDPGRPHALELTYARPFDRDALLDATLKEMRRIEGLRGDHGVMMDRLHSCFRDVEVGDRLKATALGPNRLAFALNGAPTCAVDGPSMATRFLSIWLSDSARDRRLSQKLRGD